jgi:AcrR family transcriptional regulator
MTAGRPREFDYDKALDQAMRVFWQKGYEGTSMPDLTEAMGINRPSIYAAFGNKEELFKKALERYSQNSMNTFREKLSAPKLRDAVGALLCAAASSFCCDETPKGCMSVTSALVGSDDAENACNITSSHREGIVKLLQERFEKGISDGELAPGTDTRALARLISAVLNGMSVQSAGGVPGKELKAVAEAALNAIPIQTH